MLRRYPCHAVSLALCAMLLVAGPAHAATTVTPDGTPTAAQTGAVRHALPGDFKSAELMSHHPLQFKVGLADLNGDGKPDLVIQEISSGFCGMQNCPAYALLAVPGGYSSHAITLALFPPGAAITVLDSMHHGMHDLRFDGGTHVFRWTGAAYH